MEEMLSRIVENLVGRLEYEANFNGPLSRRSLRTSRSVMGSKTCGKTAPPISGRSSPILPSGARCCEDHSARDRILKPLRKHDEFCVSTSVRNISAARCPAQRRSSRRMLARKFARSNPVPGV